MIAKVDDSNFHSNNEQDESVLISSFSSLEELALGSVSFLLQNSKIYLIQSFEFHYYVQNLNQ